MTSHKIPILRARLRHGGSALGRGVPGIARGSFNAGFCLFSRRVRGLVRVLWNDHTARAKCGRVELVEFDSRRGLPGREPGAPSGITEYTPLNPYLAEVPPKLTEKNRIPSLRLWGPQNRDQRSLGASSADEEGRVSMSSREDC